MFSAKYISLLGKQLYVNACQTVAIISVDYV